MSGGVGITDAVLDEIKQRIDLGDLIASYGVDVRHSGTALKACCPFHHEKTPSFSINSSKGFYHCFGCGESGDAIKFVQKFEGLSFVEAVKKLAAKCGVTIAEKPDPEAGRRKRLYALMAELAEFYRRCLLMTREAAPAREYLKKRNLDEETCEAWTVGYAPEGGATIRKWAQKYGYTETELAEAGVAIPPRHPGDNLYHRFGGRLMFTIRDKQGRVVAFSGRLLKERKNTGKYVNSPETAIFKKSNVLFGFDRANAEIARAEHHEVIACEGQIDCIRLHTAGFKTAVASQGTAFTEEHARMLKRVASSAVLMYDDDGAGRKATIRVAGILLALDMPVKVVALPDGDDPDSFLCKHKPEDLQKRIDNAESIMSFQCRAEMAKEENPKSLDAVQRVTNSVLATIAKCTSPVLRAAMVEEAAGLLSLPASALADELEKAMSAPKLAAYNPPPPPLPPSPQPQPQDGYDPELEPDMPEVDEPMPDEEPFAPEVEPVNAHKVIPPPKGEITLLEFLMENEYDADVARIMRETSTQSALSHDFTRKFVETWLGEVDSGTDCFAAFQESLDETGRALFDRILLGAGKAQASARAPSDIMKENVRGLWKAELERRRGALPADGGDETIVRRMELTTRIKRILQVPWPIVEEFIKSETLA